MLHRQSSVRPASQWLRFLGGPAEPRLRLICFPHAGGASSFFRGWASLLPGDVSLLGLRYPGREDRFLEPAAEHMSDLAAPVAEACVDLGDIPTVFFGHSMGASVAYEVALRLAGSPAEPEALFLSGQAGPGATRPSALAEAEDDELVQHLIGLTETNSRAFADEELRGLLLPVFRADFRLLQRYTAAVEEPALDAPVIAYFGDDDEEVDADAAKAWATVTRGGFDMRSFPGGHFYLEQQAASLIADLLARVRCIA